MRLILLWSCLIMAVAEARSEVVTVRSGQMVPVSVSRTGLSRIALSDGHRITNVWGRSSMVEVETDSEGGQVFIKPRPGATSFALYLRDERGSTYSLLMSPVDALPDSLLLQVPAAKPEVVANPRSHPQNMLHQMQLLFASSYDSGDGGGYLQQLPWWDNTRLYLVRSNVSGGLLAEHYHLHNTGTAALRLYEAEFSRLGEVVAVSVGVRQVAAGGVADIYILRRQ